jgi:hypothetical protein
MWSLCPCGIDSVKIKTAIHGLSDEQQTAHPDVTPSTSASYGKSYIPVEEPKKLHQASYAQAQWSLIP